MTLGEYHHFRELSRLEPGETFRILAETRHPGILILTPHGGGIEPGASEITLALAGVEYSYYCFEGLKENDNERLRIPSIAFDEPQCLGMLRVAQTVITVHGCWGDKQVIYIGGRDEALRERFLEAFIQTGLPAEPGGGSLSGKSQRNLCNCGASRRGVQLELSERLRRALFQSLDRRGRRIPTLSFYALIHAGREVLSSIRSQ